jgi:FkbM family methyltransferase
MTMVSYAQNHEDVLLRRVFPDDTNGFYIDVGANDPVLDSVTKHFYDRGWHGINIEPQSGPYKRLCAERRNDVNLRIGLSNRDATLELSECTAHDGVSTFSPELVNMWREKGMEFVQRRVPVTTLASVCRDHVDRTIDFLKIDVEGHEREVIEGGDWTRWRPRVVLLEATWPERWEPLILATDYLFAAFDGLNRYYVRAEDRQLLSVFKDPVCYYDDYIRHDHQRMIDEMRAQLLPMNELGPDAIAVARWLHGMSARFPRLRSTLRHLTRRGA